uniref:Uncharacterized protein n=1 Tax=Anguilla anguilla TaxID=7936 RepID=A0A0E9SQW0_ANGAN
MYDESIFNLRPYMLWGKNANVKKSQFRKKS